MRWEPSLFIQDLARGMNRFSVKFYEIPQSPFHSASFSSRPKSQRLLLARSGGIMPPLQEMRDSMESSSFFSLRFLLRISLCPLW
jgi:hypothetical protein